MENITLEQCKEMNEVQLQDVLGLLFKEKYKDNHVAKVTFTTNLIKDESNIVLKF